jgi:hypothetical protein
MDKNISKPGYGEVSKIVEELNHLPQVMVPENFEIELHAKISQLSNTKHRSVIEKVFFPRSYSNTRYLVFSASFIMLFCCIALFYLVSKYFNSSSQIESNSIDSLYFNGKKVIILPPTSTQQSTQTGQQPLKEYVEPDTIKNKFDKTEIYKYFTPLDSIELKKPSIFNKKMIKDSIKIKNQINNKKVSRTGLQKNSSTKKKD